MSTRRERRGKNQGVKKGSVTGAIKSFFTPKGVGGSKRGSGGRRRRQGASSGRVGNPVEGSAGPKTASGATARTLPGINAPLPTKEPKTGPKVGPKTQSQDREQDKVDLANYRRNRGRKRRGRAGGTTEQRAVKSGATDTDNQELAEYQKKKHGDKAKYSSKVSKKEAHRAEMKKKQEGGITSGSEKRRAKRKAKRAERTEKLQQEGMKYKAGDKKGERLLKRAKRRRDVDAGRKKTLAGTALTRIGRGALAAVSGGVTAQKGYYKRKANEKRKK